MSKMLSHEYDDVWMYLQYTQETQINKKVAKIITFV